MKSSNKNVYFRLFILSIIFVLLIIDFCLCLSQSNVDDKNILNCDAFYNDLSLSKQEIRELETSKRLQRLDQKLKYETSNEKDKIQESIKAKILQGSIKSRLNNNDNRVVDVSIDDDITITKIDNNGNIVLSISGSDFFKAGFKYGDYVSVTINDKIIDMPVCMNYTDVVCGNNVCVVTLNDDINDNKVLLAINNGDFSTVNDIAVKELIENNQYKWKFSKKYEDKQFVRFDMILSKKFDDQYIVRTNDREDYDYLSNEEFANFRMVNSNNIKHGVIYRSSTPLWGNIARNNYCLEAIQNHDVKTIINLFDDKATLDTYKNNLPNTYNNLDILASKINNDVNSNEFKEDLVKVLRYIINTNAPYLIHCNDGIDSTGIVCAIIQSLLGCSTEDIIRDYMISYYNYYNVLPNTEYYDTLAKVLIVKPLSLMFNEDVSNHPNLQKLCEKYLVSNGMTDEDIEKIKLKLTK